MNRINIVIAALAHAISLLPQSVMSFSCFISSRCQIINYKSLFLQGKQFEAKLLSQLITTIAYRTTFQFCAALTEIILQSHLDLFSFAQL